MPSVIRIQYQLPNAQYLDKLLTDDLILRYVKDAYDLSEHCVEYYDTPDWALTEAGFSLGVTRAQEIPVVSLVRGDIETGGQPGLYRGEKWVAPFDKPENAAEALLGRGAPPAFGELASSRQLALRFFVIHSSKSTTLYLPDRVRVEMSFNSGQLVADTKREPVYELGLELLFGDEQPLLNYCEQLCQRFDLKPVLLSRAQKALRLLRSR